MVESDVFSRTVNLFTFFPLSYLICVRTSYLLKLVINILSICKSIKQFLKLLKGEIGF